MCAACRKAAYGEMFHFTTSLKSHGVIQRDVTGAADLKLLAAKLFGHQTFTAVHVARPTDDEQLAEMDSTLGRLEKWLDDQFREPGDESDDTRNRWLGKDTAEVIGLIEAKLKQPGDAQVKTVGGIGKREAALAMLVTHPDMTDTQIAEAVGVNRTTPYTWPEYKAARQAMASDPPPRGAKSKDGVIEAIDE